VTPGMLRLSVLGSRNAWGRLVGIVAGIAVGTAVFLLLAGAFTALQTREDRSLWTSPSERAPLVTDGGRPVPLTDVTAAVAESTDHHGDSSITRLDIATTASSVVTVPGVGTPPEAGTYYASPALAELIDSVPPDQLADRYGTRVGLLPDDVLVGPDSLVAVVGKDEDAIRRQAGARLVTELVGASMGSSAGYRSIVGIGAIGIFFPVLLFVAIVTQLGAAQRSERFATLRLIGATPRQVTRLVAVETVATSAVGAAVGIVLGWALRPLAARISLSGAQFFPSDLAVPAYVTAGAALVMVAGTTLAAARRLHRTDIGPLGVTSELREKRPAAWRLVPVTVGFGMLAALYLASQSNPGQGAEDLMFLLMLGGFLTTILGVVVVGPWLTFQVSKVATRRATSAAGVIASSRVRQHPVATFRSVSGLVVAVFMVTVFAAASTSATPLLGMDTAPGLMPTDALVTAVPPETDAQGSLAAVRATQGVTGAAILYTPDQVAPTFQAESAIAFGADLATLGMDPVADGSAVTFPAYDYMSAEAESRAKPAAIEVTDSEALAPAFLVVRTDGTPAAVERARTAIETAVPTTTKPETRAELHNLGNRQLLDELSVLAYLGALFSIAIAGCSLAVATAAAIIDRKRVLGLLRLVGMPAHNLRRIVALEAAAPLAAVLGVSIALGFAVAWLIVESVDSRMGLGAPEPTYFLTMALGLVLALGTVAATTGTIRKSTALSSTRFE
jgi:putative ABC transport system permease protein